MYFYLPHLAYPVQAPSCVTSNDDAGRKDNSERDVRRGEKIDVLRQIVSAALPVTDSGMLYNTTR